jgi:hypothetical protein
MTESLRREIVFPHAREDVWRARSRVFFEQSGFDLSQPWGDAALRGAEAGWDRMLVRLGSVLASLAAQR